MRIVIAMPVYEDWESAFKLTANIDSMLRKELELQEKCSL